jgi:hypothetical protein
MGNRVLTVEDLTHGYNGRTLFRNAKLDVEKGERIAIIGPNGAGARRGGAGARRGGRWWRRGSEGLRQWRRRSGAAGQQALPPALSPSPVSPWPPPALP